MSGKSIQVLLKWRKCYCFNTASRGGVGGSGMPCSYYPPHFLIDLNFLSSIEVNNWERYNGQRTLAKRGLKILICLHAYNKNDPKYSTRLIQKCMCS